MVKFLTLFEVKFFHKYYDAYTAKDFTLIPSPNTQGLIKSYGLIFRQTDEGFLLLYQEQKQALLERLKEEITFEFSIYIKNKYFETFTNVVPSSETKKYVFSNKTLETNELGVESENGNQIILHPDGFVNENNVCLCCYNSIVLSELLVNDKVLIQQNGETLYDDKLESWQNAGRILGNNFGNYTLFLNDPEPINLYYLPDSLSSAFGIIELSVGGLAGSFSDLKETKYQVKFDNRKVLWNYFFVSESDMTYDTIDLFAGKEKLSFANPEEVVMINGQKALKVMSEQFFALQHRYNGVNFYAELKSSGQVELGNKRINLITPDVTRIKGKRENGNEVYYSDMILYL